MKRVMIGSGFILASLIATAQAKPAATLTPAADLKWNDVPGVTGVHMAVADGNPAKGASHFFLKFDKGFTVGEHHHTADHFGTVVAGTLMLTVDGKESMLGPGSYFALTGKKPHATKCDAAADCVLLIDARGKWDVIPAKAPAAAKDAPKPAK